jgi:hypothetical protein
MAERFEKLQISIELRWNPKTESKRGALAQILLAMGEGVANQLEEGETLSGSTWKLNGRGLIDG